MTKQQLQIALSETRFELAAAGAKVARLDKSWADCIEMSNLVQNERDEAYQVRNNALRDVAFYKRMADYLLDREKASGKEGSK